MTFVTWLDTQLKRKGWTRAELARRANLSQGALSHIYTGKRQPGHSMLNAIAKALDVPPENVYEAAGAYKPTRSPGDDKDSSLLEWIKAFKDADDDETREEMLAFARLVAERRRSGVKK